MPPTKPEMFINSQEENHRNTFASFLSPLERMRKERRLALLFFNLLLLLAALFHLLSWSLSEPAPRSEPMPTVQETVL